MADKKQKAALEQRVLQFIRKNELVKAGQKVLVAVSGGPDSVCLLHILYQLQDTLKIRLHAAHLNHQLRGDDSEADARYVASLVQNLGIPATIEKRDVKGYQVRRHLSLEEAAREVRYSFLAQTAKEVGADRVAAGHTLSDQVETILLHIIRGTGTRGLRGLQPCHTMQFSGHSLTVIRPLLETKREETEAFCSRIGLTPCLDTSNLAFSLLRNRVRGELLPLLQGYNPGVAESLLRLSRIAGDDLALLDEESAGAWREIVDKEGDTFIFAKVRFKNTAPALQRHLLRAAIDCLLGSLKDIETRHIEEILESLEKPAGKRIALPQRLIFTIEYERYLLGFDPQELVPFPPIEGEYDIQIPGETRIPGWKIEAAIVPPESTSTALEGVYPGERDKLTACFDKDKIGAKIILRARRKGDCFQPFGMTGPKKVGRFMIAAKIPQTWRERIPILCSEQQIIWVAGWRIDERVKVDRGDPAGGLFEDGEMP